MNYRKTKILIPFWQSDIIYEESIMFMETDRTAALMLPAEEILEVMSSDKQIKYEEGRDYILKDGIIVRPEGSHLPVMPLAEYYPDPETAEPGTFFPSEWEGHPIIRYSEEPVFVSRQLLVTYRPAEKWSGPVPHSAHKLSRFWEKAYSGEETRIVYYGDSITTGYDCSMNLKREPWQPAWFDMVTEKIKEETDNHHIIHINTSVAGMDSQWALDNIDERVIAYRPDLLVYAFGMNDAGKTPEQFIELTDRSVRKVREAVPDCDILLVSPMLPHKRFRGFWGNQYKFEKYLTEYAEKSPGTEPAPVTSLHAYMLRRKEYYHATGNNVNHPNDFLHRLYAQTVLEVL